MKRKKVTDPIRTAVFVSGGGTNLQALIDKQEKNGLGAAKIVLVVSSSKSAYAINRAYEHEIPCVIADRKSCAGQQEFEDQINAALTQYGIEMIVLAGFLSILSEDFVKRWPKRILNIHPSLIPAFCGKGYYGLRVHEAALKRGVKVTGATVHFVNEIPDGGEIILQKAIAIHKNDTPESLQLRVMKQAEWQLLPRAVELVSYALLAEREGLPAPEIPDDADENE